MLVGRPPFETSEVKKTYERIKRNAYSYPDYVPLSEHAKSIIGRLLVLDPCTPIFLFTSYHHIAKRLSLDEILQHPFMGNW
jgi:polo-like kinase 1